MENMTTKEIIITTKMAFPMLSLLNKLKLREPLIAVVNKQIGFQNRKESVFKELNERTKYDGEITPQVMIELLNGNLDLAEKLNEIEGEMRCDVVNFIFEIIEKIPLAESEFYKTMSVITGKKPKEIESMELNETVDIITSVVMSRSFMGLLNVMKK